jgi:hypothetical protein
MGAGDAPDAPRRERVVEGFTEQSLANIRLVLTAGPKVLEPEAIGRLLTWEGGAHRLARFGVGFDADGRSLGESLVPVLPGFVVHSGP